MPLIHRVAAGCVWTLWVTPLSCALGTGLIGDQWSKRLENPSKGTTTIPQRNLQGKKEKFSTVLLLVYKSCADLRKVCHVFLSFFISLARTTSSRHCFLKENSRWNKARSRNGDLDSGFGEGLSEDWKAARGLGRSPGTNDRFMKRHSI